ncbi:uncharacterized protein LOC125530477 isoform X2 [Triticum urartu]|uniref:uncharacterized protein LOC125530477 isoform X2 n=1 Tax=Triticum urartu TaxID=4572 RepID=UPI0020438C99|nr:uncharacterized protein LOC125530477 isoform X2 [Triticum urartu]
MPCPSLSSKLAAGDEAYGTATAVLDRLQEPGTRAEARDSWAPSIAALPMTPPPGRRSASAPPGTRHAHQVLLWHRHNSGRVPTLQFSGIALRMQTPILQTSSSM